MFIGFYIGYIIMRSETFIKICNYKPPNFLIKSINQNNLFINTTFSNY